MSGSKQLGEHQERKLVEKVDLRLVLAKDDVKFEQVLNTFLPPLLLKLASPYSSVRELVLKSIKHVSHRVNSNTALKLPVMALLSQTKKPNLQPGQVATEVIVQSAYFLSIGVDRLDTQESRLLVPEVIDNLHSLPSTVSSRLFHILCKLLLKWQAPLKATPAEKDTVEFLHVSEPDVQYLLEKFTKFFLLPARKQGLGYGTASCPGLSSRDVSFFLYAPSISFSKDLLNELKRSVFNFCASGFVLDESALVEFLLVVSAQQIDVSDTASTMLKRVEIPFEDKDFILELCHMFYGDSGSNLPPVNAELQQRILRIFTRSSLITKDLPGIPYRISIQGLQSENHKVNLATLAFIRHVTQFNHRALDTDAEHSADSLITLIRNNIEVSGWPAFNGDAYTQKAGIDLRASQYETLGSLLNQNFDAVKDFRVIRFLLDSLRGDLPVFRATINDVLSSLVHHLPGLPSESKNLLKDFLSGIMKSNFILFNGTSEEKEALMSLRFIGMKFNNAAFGFEDIEARLYSILGTHELNRPNIIQEASIGLDPYQFRVRRASLQRAYVSTDVLLAKDIIELQFVDFSSFVELFLTELSNVEEFSVLKHCVPTGVLFIDRALISNSTTGVSTMIVQDENWSTRIEKALEIDDKVHDLVRNYIKHIDVNIIRSLLTFLFSELTEGRRSSSEDNLVFGTLFVLIVRNTSVVAMKSLTPLISPLNKYMESKDLLLNPYSDYLLSAFGLIAARSYDTVSSLSEIIIKISESDLLSDDQNSNNTIYMAAFMLPRLMLVQSGSAKFKDVLLKTLENAFSLYCTGVQKDIALKSICQILKYKVLSFCENDKAYSVLMKIKDSIKDKLYNNELGIMTWGYLHMNLNPDLSSDSFDVYEKVHSSKYADFLFASGESMCLFLGGWNSKFLERQLDIEIDVEDLKKDYNPLTVAQGVTKVLSLCSSTKPSLQKASCVWLLSIVQHLGHLEAVSDKFYEIHTTFMRFLAHREDFVKELASRGLSIVYDSSEATLREIMVKSLFRTLTDSNTALTLQSGTVSEETQLFEPGLMKTNDGSVSTYKDILNLANEVNDPSLVYKFMALAKHSSLWSSRKGVAFGLSAIMSKVSLQEQLSDDVALSKRIVPKLFRYRFDPSSTVSNSMSDIWNTLIPDSSKTIETHFEDVLDECLRNSSNKEWRVREACCKALLNLLQTFPFSKFESRITEIWTIAFRLMDDIKDSVRTSGTSLARYLSKLLIKSLNNRGSASTSKPMKILDIVIPFLLGPKGLNNDAEDVRKFAVKMLLDLIKDAGSALKDYIPTLVYELTILLSVLEPQAINYLSLNAEKFNITVSELDGHRAQGVTGSPIMQAIESLIEASSSANNLSELVDACIRASKRSVGLPSGIGSARLFQLMSIQYSTSLEPFSGKFLKACIHGMDNRSQAIAAAYALSLGRMLKVSSLPKQIKYSKILVEKFFETEDSEKQEVVGICLKSAHNYSPVAFDNVSSILMPLVFIAKSGDDGKVSKIFNDVWNEASKSGSSSLNLCFPEIVQLVSINIHSNIFSIKKLCAIALCEASIAYGGQLKSETIQSVFHILLEACHGRSWVGKDRIVRGVVQSFEKMSSKTSIDSEIVEKIDKMLIAEVSRTNESYVKSLLQPFAEYVLYRNEPALYDKLTEIIELVFSNLELDDVAGNSSSDDDAAIKKQRLNSDVSRVSSQSNIQKEMYKIGVIKTVAEGLKDLVGKDNGIDANQVLVLLSRFMNGMFESSKIIHTWRSELAFYEIAFTMLESYDKANPEFDVVSDVFVEIWKYGFSFCHKRETIENVKVKMIRFGGLLKSKFPNRAKMVDEDILAMLKEGSTSILLTEAGAIGVNSC